MTGKIRRKNGEWERQHDGHGLLCRTQLEPTTGDNKLRLGISLFCLFFHSPLCPYLQIMALRTNISSMEGKINRAQKNSANVVKLPTPDDSDVSQSDQDSGVDEEALQNLVRALGEDGLDEFDLTQLRMLTGSDEEESGEDDDADTTNESENIEQADGEGEQEEEGIALDDEDVDSVDEDAIPRRKVQVDNKVSPVHFPTHKLILTPMHRSRSNAYGTPLN